MDVKREDIAGVLEAGELRSRDFVIQGHFRALGLRA